MIVECFGGDSESCAAVGEHFDRVERFAYEIRFPKRQVVPGLS